MPIVRMSKEQRKRFVIVDRGLLDDPRLSLRDKGVAVSLLALPDDWSINARFLANRGPDGEDAVLASFKRLREAGYLVTEKTRDAEGRLRTVNTLHEAPVTARTGSPSPGPVQPVPGSPESVLPSADPPDAARKLLPKTVKQKTEVEKPEQGKTEEPTSALLPATPPSRVGEAEKIVSGFIASAHPVPVSPVRELVRLAETFLGKGYSGTEIEVALRTARTHTPRAMEYVLREGREPVSGPRNGVTEQIRRFIEATAEDTQQVVMP